MDTKYFNIGGWVIVFLLVSIMIFLVHRQSKLDGVNQKTCKALCGEDLILNANAKYCECGGKQGNYYLWDKK